MDYISCVEAKQLRGLRLVLSAGGPGPWGEAAKSIFHVKQVRYVAVRQEGLGQNDELFAWTGTRNAPVAMYDDERPRHSWVDILYLAERLGSGPSLLPERRELQIESIGLSHQICGEDGLGWNRRLDIFKLTLDAAGGDASKTILTPRMFADYLATAATMARSTDHVIDILDLFDGRLRRQVQEGSKYLVGDRLTATDVHFAAFLGMLEPLPYEVNAMPESLRAGYTSGSPALRAAVTPRLVAHRDFIYRTYLKLPLDF